MERLVVALLWLNSGGEGSTLPSHPQNPLGDTPLACLNLSGLSAGGCRIS